MLELDPANPGNGHLGAATSLERLYQQTERYEPLAAILLKKATMLESPDEQKEHLFRAASIHEEILERPMDAIAVFHKVLEVDSKDLGALDKLVELYMKLVKWPELLDTYTKKAEVIADPDEKKRLYLEVGAVYERELAQGEKAIDTYQKILEIDPWNRHPQLIAAIVENIRQGLLKFPADSVARSRFCLRRTACRSGLWP